MTGLMHHRDGEGEMIRVHLKPELRQCCDECERDRELSDARTKHALCTRQQSV